MREAALYLLVIFLVLTAHPYLIYPWSLKLLPKHPVKPLSVDYCNPPAAICMSAFNEEQVIVAKMEALLAMAAVYGPARILVYVDGATDQTAQLLELYRDRIDLVVSPKRQGKTVGMKELISRTDAELLAFTDANVEVAPDSLLLLAAKLQDPEICCASARLNYSNHDETGQSAASGAYWNIEEAIKALETERVSLIGVDGALFVIKRDAYFPPPNDLIDDLYVSMKALLTGRRLVSESLVTVKERNATRWQEEFHRKMRISCQGMRVHRALWAQIRRAPPVIVYCYLSHRVLKWATPFTLTGATLCILGLLASFIGILPAIGVSLFSAALLGLGGWLNAPYCRLLLTALASLAGVAVGQIQSFLTSEAYATWTPADTVRR